MSDARSYRWLPVLIAIAGSVPACEGDEPDRERVFRDDVVPVLESRCAADVCHGVTPAKRGVEQDDPGENFVVRTDGEGQISDWREARRESLRFVNTEEDADFSSLIRKPLPSVYGGLPHEGGDNFVSLDDSSARTLRRWIELENRGGEDPEPPGLNTRREKFADDVLPRLIGRGCGTTNCHGESAFNDFRLDPGMPDPDGKTRFSQAMIRDNYEMARSFLALDGDPTESRLLKKGLPLEEGGITHRGGNRTFFTGREDEAAQALIEWARRERASEWPEVGDNESSLRGMVYVEGPVRPGSPFDVTTYNPGGDLYLRTPAGPDGEVRNLTGGLHDGEVDIRDPAVSDDGRRIAFSMRTAVDEGYALYELDLETGEVDRRTDASGADVMATYGPEGRLYFVSDRHVPPEATGRSDLAIYSLEADGDDESPTRLTFGMGPEINPRTFDVGGMQGHLTVAHRRQLGEDDETVGFEFPLDLGADYHIFFGATAPEEHFLVFEEMPDGRALTILGDPENRWAGGRLALVDRNLGPDLPPDQSDPEPAVFGFAQTRRLLDSSTSASGVSYGGVYRDPVALPDGSILVAWAPGPVDLSDPDADPKFRILHLTLEEAPDGCTTLDCRPRIDRSRAWVEARSREASVHSPRPVVRRTTASVPERSPEPGEPATFEVADAPVHQGILENPFAAGPKEFRDDVRFLRLVEAIPPEDRRGETRRSATDHPPARILGEVELEADGSAYLEIPPETPFRVQLLDEDRMAVGAQHNRWIFAWPGQSFPMSVDRDRYQSDCGGCHGSRTGAPEDLVEKADASTGASVTLATFEDRNPRRPKEPKRLGAETRRQVTFEDDVQPVLDRRCVETDCHADGPNPAGDLVLEGEPTEDFSTSYEALMAPGDGSGGGRKYVDARKTSARNSVLVEVAADRELAAPRPLSDHPDPEVTDGELSKLVEWIETGAAFERVNSGDDGGRR